MSDRPPPEVGRHPSLASLMPERGLVRVGPELSDRLDRTWWEGQLDRLGEQVFAGRGGPERATPLLARWDAQVGRLGAGDLDYPLLQAARVDWALCDAEPPGARPGGMAVEDFFAAVRRLAAGRQGR